MTQPAEPGMAHALIAAGALFLDDAGRVLLVRPTYKEHWDIPGGYAEPGESPRAACLRELHEELAIEPALGPLLVVDWAPAEGEGDKLLFVFDGGTLTSAEVSRIVLADDELAELRFVAPTDVAQYVPPRLTRRLTTAIRANRRGETAYAEHGTEVRTAQDPTTQV